MNKTKFISLIGVAVLLATTTLAQEPPAEIQPGPPESWYSGKDWRLDLGAVYRVHDPRTRGDWNDRDDWGTSFGGQVFFTKYLGVSVDTYLVADRVDEGDNVLADVGHSVFEDANLSLVARYPLGRFAPYALGGVGRNFNWGEYTAHAAAGLEIRFADNFGVYAEGRYTWSNGHRRLEDSGQWRFGARLWGQR